MLALNLKIGQLKLPFKETGLFYTVAHQPREQYIMQQQIFSSNGFLTDSIAICAGFCKVEGLVTKHFLTRRYTNEKKFIIIILMQLLSHEEMFSCFCEVGEMDLDDNTNKKEKYKIKRMMKKMTTSGQLRSVRLLNIKISHLIRSGKLLLEFLLVRHNGA